MQISALFDALRRRLLPLLVVLLLALAAGAYGWTSTKTAYDATAVAVLVPGQASPQPGVDQGSTNPLDRVGFATTQLATLATVAANAPSLQERLTQETGATLISANNTAQERTSAPQPGIQIVIMTRGDNLETAVAGGRSAVKLLDDQIQDLQKKVGVPAAQRAKVMELIPAEGTASSSTSRFRAAGGLLLGVAGLGTVLVLGFDAWQHRRRRARASEDVRRTATTQD